MRRITRAFFLTVILGMVILARRGLAEPPLTAGEEAVWVELHAPGYDEDGPG